MSEVGSLLGMEGSEGSTTEPVENEGGSVNEPSAAAEPEPSAEPDEAQSQPDQTQLLIEQLNKLVEQLKNREQPQQEKPQPQESFEIDISDDECEAALADAGSLKKLLTSIVSRSVEQVMKKIPNLVMSTTQHYVTLNDAVKDFYKTNPDLVPHKSFVGFVANELASAHPEWNYEQLVKEVGSEVRRRLGIKPQTKAAPPKPALPPRASGGQRQVPIQKAKPAVRDDIKSLIEALS